MCRRGSLLDATSTTTKLSKNSRPTCVAACQPPPDRREDRSHGSKLPVHPPHLHPSQPFAPTWETLILASPKVFVNRLAKFFSSAILAAPLDRFVRISVPQFTVNRPPKKNLRRSRRPLLPAVPHDGKPKFRIPPARRQHPLPKIIFDSEAARQLATPQPLGPQLYRPPQPTQAPKIQNLFSNPFPGSPQARNRSKHPMRTGRRAPRRASAGSRLRMPQRRPRVARPPRSVTVRPCRGQAVPWSGRRMPCNGDPRARGNDPAGNDPAGNGAVRPRPLTQRQMRGGQYAPARASSWSSIAPNSTKDIAPIRTGIRS